MAKSRSRFSLEETGPRGSCFSGEGLQPCLSSASCGISGKGAQPTQGQCPHPCSTFLSPLWYLLALLLDGYGHIWPHLGDERPGAGSRVCSHLPSLLLSPPPVHFPTIVTPGPMGGGGILLGRPHQLPLEKGTSRENHPDGRQGSSHLPSVFTLVFLPCFSYRKALP